MPEAFATPVSRRQTIATLGAGVAGLALTAPARAFAETLGYVLAAIGHCGGPPAEVAQFERHALAMLAKYTPDAADRARLRDWAEGARQRAAPHGGD